ncbi:MAG TPA: glycosyltransferase family 4 protein [Solirubrobacteraceae bacterium]|nr:glycosyltransferase family 4 protein [Solirubrobacteraceae bacterium]
MTIRVSVVAPVAAPYREPLFAALHVRPELALEVIYAAATQPSWDVPDDFFATEHAYPARHLRSTQIPRPGRTPVMFPRGLERALAAGRPDVIVASEFGPLAIRARLWAGRHGLPYLLLSECTPATNPHLPAAQLRWHRHFARHVDGAIVVSSAGQRRLRDFGVAPERITVALQSADLVPLRAALAAIHPPRPPAPAGAVPDPGAGAVPTPGAQAGATPSLRAGPSPALRVLCVARLVPDKNIALLARALAQARLDLGRPRVILEVVGEGFLRERLVRTVTELGLEAHFLGHLGPAELARAYSSADVFALPSRFEPFGVVVREAAAAGLPILTTTAVGAVGDIAVDGENAILVAPDDLSGTSVALTRLLGDPALRARMAAASRAIDARTDGGEADAFTSAVIAAATGDRSRPPQRSCVMHRPGMVRGRCA